MFNRLKRLKELYKKMKSKEKYLERCPFCGSEAKTDNGFMPLESIEYVWCSNTDCVLNDVLITRNEWNTRYE